MDSPAAVCHPCSWQAVAYVGLLKEIYKFVVCSSLNKSSGGANVVSSFLLLLPLPPVASVIVCTSRHFVPEFPIACLRCVRWGCVVKPSYIFDASPYHLCNGGGA